MRRITQSDLGVNGSHVPAGLPPADVPSDAEQPQISDALRAANERLLALRRQRGVGVARETHAAPAADTRNVAPGQHSALPAHLGWHSARLTALLRSQTPTAEPQPVTPFIPLPTCEQPSSPPSEAPEQLRVYPALLLALLRHERAAAGRIWLLARHLDSAGRGWLTLDALQQALCADDSPLRVVGRRRLRQLLAEGEGLFWQRDHERSGRVRVWLTGIARVAQALGLAAVDRPVWLPTTALTGSIADVRAHFYAAFHSKRAAQDADGWGSPIARRTLHRLSGRSARTQRRYDQRLDVARRSTLAIGPRFTAEALQQQLWQGYVAFEFVDSRGEQGPPGAHYVAWRLPNQYRGCHQRAARGRQCTINRHLRRRMAGAPATSDLVTKRGRGNGIAGGRVERCVTLFCRAGDVAAGVSHDDRARVTDRYWPARRAGVWHVWQKSALAARQGKPGGND